MISYDDLVVALASWRARQGLPVVQVPGAAPAAAARSAPPAPPRGHPVAADDFDESALVESYDASDDYVVGVEPVGEPTAIGSAPDPADGLLVPKRGRLDR